MLIVERDARLKEAETFLTILFAQLPDDHIFYLWFYDQNKRTMWFQTVADAMVEVGKHLEEQVYVGRGVARANRLKELEKDPHKRLSNSDADGVVAFVADIDHQHGVHSKSDHLLPLNFEAADGIARGMRLMPTMRVRTGHGVHAWWVLEEPWLFEDDEDREAAAVMLRRWHNTLKADMQAMGKTLDSTFDLARVMRLPGTENRKEVGEGQRGIRVRLIDHVENGTWDITQIEDRLIDDSYATASGEKAEMFQRARDRMLNPDVPFDPTAKYPDKFDDLLQKNKTVADIWSQDGKAKTERTDDTQSSWDMSLCNAIYLAWMPLYGNTAEVEEDVLNTLIHYRRKYGDPNDKLVNNEQYFLRTVHSARVAAQGAQRTEKAEDAFQELKLMVTEGPPPDSEMEQWREKLLRFISETLTDKRPVIIDEIRGYVTESKKHYVFSINGHEMGREGARIFVSQNDFKLMVIDGAATKIKPMPKEDWEAISDAMILAVKTVEEVDSTQASVINSLVDEFIEQQIVTNHAALYIGLPNVINKNGQLYIRAGEFSKFLRKDNNINIPPDRMNMIIDGIGIHKVRLKVLVDIGNEQQNKQVWYWQLPKEQFSVESFVVPESDRDVVLAERLH